MEPNYDEQLLLDYVEGELSSSDQTRLQKMIQEDPRLADLLEGMKDDRQIIQKIPDPNAPDWIMEEVDRRLERLLLLDSTPAELEQRVYRQRGVLKRLVTYGSLAAMLLVSSAVIIVSLLDEEPDQIAFDVPHKQGTDAVTNDKTLTDPLVRSKGGMLKKEGIPEKGDVSQNTRLPGEVAAKPSVMADDLNHALKQADQPAQQRGKADSKLTDTHVPSPKVGNYNSKSGQQFASKSAPVGSGSVGGVSDGNAANQSQQSLDQPSPNAMPGTQQIAMVEKADNTGNTGNTGSAVNDDSQSITSLQQKTRGKAELAQSMNESLALNQEEQQPQASPQLLRSRAGSPANVALARKAGPSAPLDYRNSKTGRSNTKNKIQNIDPNQLAKEDLNHLQIALQTNDFQQSAVQLSNITRQIDNAVVVGPNAITNGQKKISLDEAANQPRVVYNITVPPKQVNQLYLYLNTLQNQKFQNVALQRQLNRALPAQQRLAKDLNLAITWPNSAPNYNAIITEQLPLTPPATADADIPAVVVPIYIDNLDVQSKLAEQRLEQRLNSNNAQETQEAQKSQQKQTQNAQKAQQSDESDESNQTDDPPAKDDQPAK